MTDSISIRSLATVVGFDLCAVTTPEPIAEATAAYASWLKDGHHADMAYMAKEPERRADPTKVLLGAKSVIVLGLNHYTEDTAGEPPDGFGRVARYARGRDYHKVIEKKLKLLVEKIKSEIPDGADAEYRTFVDYGPILEKAFAQKAGLGFIGQNGLLIHERFGTWLFLAEILTTLEIVPDTMDDVVPDCGDCTACIDACPTGALLGEGRLDARRCFSYLTIEHKGEIVKELTESMGNLVFGCDICQEVCPHNQQPALTAHSEFCPESGVGEFLDCNKILRMETREEFLELMAGTPLTRPKLDGLQRNARIVLDNNRWSKE